MLSPVGAKKRGNVLKAMHIYSTKIWQASTQGLIIVILVFLFPAISHSDTSQLEIEHLYTTILNSNCDWMRNNKHYTPSEAVKHLQKKADFHKKEINTAEDFIRLAATKSTFSGRYYG